ncbi:P-loop NTPase fold protein, partial [Cytobacillus horneckiae]|uniref:P-loop NTPase fold protein n=1 Tax=Cytobacillus horneckiae TaxID=549687 RepID=UPI0034CDDE87
MKADKIFNILLDFKGSNYQRILINGEWGIGKTRYVKEFLEYNPDHCYISLFGKKDIESIIQEIYFFILKQDNQGATKVFNDLWSKFQGGGFTLGPIGFSIPAMNNMLDSLTKSLEDKNSFVFILDDIERKQSGLEFREVLGLIDSLTSTNNVKVVLVCATEKLESSDVEILKDYKEKAVDREYKITRYADDAPKNIISGKDIKGEQPEEKNEIWEAIKPIAEAEAIQNLRVYEKTRNFINEVIDRLPADIYSEKLSKEDIYKLCFVSVIFIVIDKGNYLKLSEKNKDRPTRSSYIIDYLLNEHVPRKVSNLLLGEILTWYESGHYPEITLNNMIQILNNSRDLIDNFYLSEEQIKDSINEIKDKLKYSSFEGDILNILIYEINEAIGWSKELDIEFGYSVEYIVEKLKDTIEAFVDTNLQLHQNIIPKGNYLTRPHLHSLIDSVNREITYIYLTKKLKMFEED